jgi:hypothetical protein
MKSRLRTRPARAGSWLGIALIAGSAIAGHVNAAAGNPASPFFMLTTSNFPDPGEHRAVAKALRRHVTRDDYLSFQLARQFPDLADRVGRAHLYALVPSHALIAKHAAYGCGPGTPGLIIYDAEHWDATPQREKADMIGAIAQGRSLARQDGCHDYGVAPDGEYAGIAAQRCVYDLDAGIIRGIDWQGISLLVLQSQILLGDRCNSPAAMRRYIDFVTAIASEVRAKSATVRIVAQLSFRHTPPERMIAAMRGLRGVVTGFYIAYPSNVGPHCAHCSPANLDAVLAAVRTP